MAEVAAPVEVIWTWASLLQLAVTTGLCTALLNQALAWVKEAILLRQKNLIEGRKFALELVELLAAFAQECSSRIAENEFDERSGEHGRNHKMPVLREFPEGPWGLLPSKLAAGIRNLRNEVEEATRDIQGVGEVDGYPESVNTATSRLGTAGYAASLLSRHLRRHYGFGHYQAVGISSFEAELRKKYRANHPNLIKRLWRSLVMYRLRWRLSRLISRIKRKLARKV